MTISITFSDKTVRVAVEINGVIESAIIELPKREWVGLDTFDRMALRTNHTTMIQHYHDESTNTTHIGEKTNWCRLFDAIEAKLKEKNT